MSDLIFLSIQFYGLAIVISFLVAVLIKGIVVALPLMRRREETQAQAPVEPPAGVPAEHIAAIAASVAALVGPSHIIHIEDRGRSTVWATEGRMLHQTSHATRHTRSS